MSDAVVAMIFVLSLIAFARGRTDERINDALFRTLFAEADWVHHKMWAAPRKHVQNGGGGGAGGGGGSKRCAFSP